MRAGRFVRICVAVSLAAAAAACSSEPQAPPGAFFKGSESSLRYPGPYDTTLDSEQVKALQERAQLQR